MVFYVNGKEVVDMTNSINAYPLMSTGASWVGPTA